MIRFALALLLLLLPTWASAQTTAHLWVDGSGTCVDNASPVVYDSATACATVDAAWTAADAGDIVRVKTDGDGIYPEAPAAAVNGTSGNVITIIAEDAITMCGMAFSANSYIRVIGFVFDGNATGCARSSIITLAGAQTGLEFWHNTIRDGTNGFSSSITSSSTDMCDACIWVGNIFIDLGDTCSGAGAVSRGNDQFWGYNSFSGMWPDAHYVFGTRSRFVNEYQVNANGTGGCHTDSYQYSSNNPGLSFLLIEGFYQEGGGAGGDEHASNLTAQDEGTSCTGSVCGAISNNVYRRNLLYNIGSGTWNMPGSAGDEAAGWSPFFLYQDTHVNVGLTSTTYSMVVPANTVSHIHNSIFYQAWGTANTTNLNPFLLQGGGGTANRSLAFDPDGSVTFAASWTNQANELSNIDPELVNPAGDFTLQATSGAIGAAGAITTTSGSATSATFTVATGMGGAFRGPNTTLTQYGGDLTDGDVLTVGTDTCTVASVSADDVTCEETFTWANAEGVFFGTDTTPDIGAYPYKAGGYTLTATVAEVGGTATVTPNDADLVRFVICYEDGIPTTVDHRSPYTCSYGSGTRRYDVYKRYAAPAPAWVSATVDAVLPANLVIPRRILRSPGDDD